MSGRVRIVRPDGSIELASGVMSTIIAAGGLLLLLTAIYWALRW
jgi:hypothetical protein